MELAFLLAVVLAISLALVPVFLLPMLVLPMPLLLHLLVLLTTWLFLLVPVLGLGLVPVLTLVLVLFLMAGLEACHPTYQRQTKTIMCGIAGSGQCWGVRKYILSAGPLGLSRHVSSAASSVGLTRALLPRLPRRRIYLLMLYGWLLRI